MCSAPSPCAGSHCLVRVWEAGINFLCCVSMVLLQWARVCGWFRLVAKKRKSWDLLIRGFLWILWSHMCHRCFWISLPLPGSGYVSCLKLGYLPHLKLSLIPFAMSSTLGEPSGLHLLVASPCSHCAVNSLLLLLLGLSLYICIII